MEKLFLSMVLKGVFCRIPKSDIFSPRLLSLLFFISLHFSVWGQDLSFIEKEGRITLYDNGYPRFSYQKETKSLNGQYARANYVHPLYGLSGEVLTEDFPEDHLHHRGVFWSWHQLYVKDTRIGDPWLCEGISWEVDTVFTKSDKKSAVLKATVFWVPVNANGQDTKKDPVLKEDISITYSKSGLNYYELDFEVLLTPLVEPVKIGGSEDEKGYGGFSVRLKTPEDMRFFSKEGEVTPQNTPIEAGGWIDIKEGSNPNDNEETGVILMCEPEALASFQGWILRKSKSMQNPAFPGREPLLIEKEKPLYFKNKIIVYQGSLSLEEIENKYSAFIKRGM